MSRFGYPIFDAGNHLYETQDALTRHLPATHKNLFRLIELNGRKKLMVRDRLTEFIPNPTFEVVARPGAYVPFFKGDNPEGKTFRELTGTPMKSIPAFREPASRLALLDEQGIDAALMFPTLFSLVEERLKDDPDAIAVAVRAFNEWLHDEWTYNYQGRIFATPVLNPGLLDEGIAELERVIERGARAVLMRPAPVSGLRGGRSPFLPEFDPFWARVQEAGLVVRPLAYGGNPYRLRRGPRPCAVGRGSTGSEAAGPVGADQRIDLALGYLLGEGLADEGRERDAAMRDRLVVARRVIERADGRESVGRYRP
jgi:Amidohydrolase